MSTHARGVAMFTGLVDLAAAGLGGEVLAASDDFFASKDNLLLGTPPVFLPDEYTDRGKWMDGWESRRKRTPGHDWAIVRLGTPGVIRGLDIDTSHFLGNHPPYASVEALRVDAGDATDAAALAKRQDWVEILEQVPLRPGSQNMFAVAHAEGWPRAFTHLRLNIYPDGGVARLRVYGVVDPDGYEIEADDEVKPRLQAGEIDLAAVKNGGIALACSDMFFGPMNNLILPGRSANMGGGWETRRRRGPGFDWIVLRLGCPGTIGMLEVDTQHFKGNYPDRCSVEAIHSPHARLTELVHPEAAWRGVLPETKLQAHSRVFFREEIEHPGPFTHVRLSIYPDGGIARFRVWGRRSPKAS
jgi:allantoicase